MGLHNTQQLVFDGWTRRRITQARASGELDRLRRGVYLSDAPDDPAERHLLAMEATRQTLRGAFWFSHESAAVALGLPVCRHHLALVQVTRDRRGGAATSASLKQWACPVPEAERAVARGLPVTTMARTIADLARSSEGVWAVAAADHAVRTGGVSLEEVTDLLAESPRRPGNALAKERLALVEPRSESVGESISRVNMVLAGIPAPVLQQEFVLPGGARVRTDFWWPEYRLVGEFDGALKYRDGLTPYRDKADVLVAEKAREDGLRSLGITVVRWGWQVALNRPVLAATIRGAIRTAQSAA